MQVVYSTEAVPNLEGRKFQNPRHFLMPLEGVTKVYIAGDWPEIRQAYEAEKVEVADISEMRALPKTAARAVKQPKKPAENRPADGTGATES